MNPRTKIRIEMVASVISLSATSWLAASSYRLGDTITFVIAIVATMAAINWLHGAWSRL